MEVIFWSLPIIMPERTMTAHRSSSCSTGHCVQCSIKKLDRELIRYAFELRMMAAGGEYPQVFECAVCGAKHDLCAFLTDKNSVMCRSCVSKVQRSTPVLESTIYTMQYVISTPVERLFAFALSAQVKKEFISLVEKFRRRYIDRDFKSLEILEIMRQTRNALYKDGQ